jgi:hypothetical protein
MMSPAAREVIRLFLSEPGRVESVRKAVPKKPAAPAPKRRPSRSSPPHAESRTAESVFHDAAAAVPSPSALTGLAEAFDAAKQKFNTDPRYGTPLSLPATPVGKSTGSTFADVVAHAIREAR